MEWPRLVTVAEAAVMLRVSERTVRRLLSDHEDDIRVMKVAGSRTLRYDSRDLMRARAADSSPHAKAGVATDLVAYFRFGNRCHISATSNLFALSKKLPWEALVAYEVGGFQLARERQAMFTPVDGKNTDRWFEWSPELAAHTLELSIKANPDELYLKLYQAERLRT